VDVMKKPITKRISFWVLFTAIFLLLAFNVGIVTFQDIVIYFLVSLSLAYGGIRAYLGYRQSIVGNKKKIALDE